MDKKLYIHSQMTGYDEEQAGETMTVGQLIEWLECVENKDMPVYLFKHNMTTFSAINPTAIYEGKDLDNAVAIDELYWM